MPQIAIEIRPEQIEQVIREMSPAEQKELERKLWAIRMDRLVGKMRKNARKNKVTQAKINKICEQVRQELYEKNRR